MRVALQWNLLQTPIAMISCGDSKNISRRDAFLMLLTLSIQ